MIRNIDALVSWSDMEVLMERYKYIGKEGLIPFGSEVDCELIFPKGPKGPVTVRGLYDAITIDKTYANKKEMLGDWLPAD